MTKNEHYKLCLKEFDVNLSKNWKELRDDEDFCDVTLACENNQIEAHKVILSASSPMFKDLLKRNPHPRPLIYLRGMSYGHLVNLLDFIYTGEAKITSEELDVFLSMAHELQIKGLTEEGQDKEEILKREIKPEVIQNDGMDNDVAFENENVSILSDLKESKEPLDDIFKKDVEDPSAFNKNIELSEAQVEPLLKSDGISNGSPKRKFMYDSGSCENKMQKIDKTSEKSQPFQRSIDNVSHNLNYLSDYTNLEKNNTDPTAPSFLGTDIFNINQNYMQETEKAVGIFTRFQQVLKYNDGKIPHDFSQEQSVLQNDDNKNEKLEQETLDQSAYILPEKNEHQQEEINAETSHDPQMYPYHQYYSGQYIHNTIPMESMTWGNYIEKENEFENSLPQKMAELKNSAPQEMINQNNGLPTNTQTSNVSHLNIAKPLPCAPIIKSEKPNDYETTDSENPNDYETTASENPNDYEVTHSIEKYGHNEIEYSLNNNLNACGKCNLKFSNKTNLDEHTKCMHDMRNDDQILTKAQNKDNPMNNKEENKIEPSSKSKTFEKIKSELILKSCEKCDFVTTQTHILGNHKKTVHDGIGFPCDRCNFNGTQRTSLRRHVLSVHEKVRYSCELCPYSATQKPILNKHLRVKH